MSYWLDEQGQRWDVAAALRRATRSLRAGDVLLIEVHLPGPHHPDDGSQDGYLPVEYWEESFDAIRRAVDRGIYVVEAAGNGGEDLDHQDYRGRLSRGARDSGAILVGGGASLWSGTPHARMSWSNYGSRVDVQGWGEDVVTTGGTQREDYCNLWNPGVASRCYTRTFGGTSSASPIVTGAVACIAGAIRAAGRPPLAPRAMRELLVTTGTPQREGPFGGPELQIGPLPNIAAALTSLGIRA